MTPGRPVHRHKLAPSRLPFTIPAPSSTMEPPAEKIPCRRPVKPQNQKNMGDKSPKANQKKSGQKQSKATSASQKKSAAIAAKSSAAKKK